MYNVFSYEHGVVNNVMTALGMNPLRPAPYAHDPAHRAGDAQAVEVHGHGSLVYPAASTGLDQDIFEATTIDGTSTWQKVRHSTIPHQDDSFDPSRQASWPRPAHLVAGQHRHQRPGYCSHRVVGPGLPDSLLPDRDRLLHPGGFPDPGQLSHHPPLLWPAERRPVHQESHQRAAGLHQHHRRDAHRHDHVHPAVPHDELRARPQGLPLPPSVLVLLHHAVQRRPGASSAPAACPCRTPVRA